MLIGSWRLHEIDDDQLGDAGPLLTLNDDGTFVNDKGGGGVNSGSYEYDEAAKTLRLSEGGRVVIELPILELSADTFVGKMGPQRCTFRREVAAASAAAPPPAASGPPTIYQLSFSTNNCEATVTLNGFPILRSKIDDDSTQTQPVNPLLVGAGNRLVIEVTGKGENARLEGSLSVVGHGDIVEVGGAGEISLLEGDPPQTMVETFDSAPAPFADVLASARAGGIDEALDFGLQLRDALRSRDDAAVGALFEPKVALLAAAFGEEPATMRGHLAGLLEMAFGSDLAFERADLAAISHCDGKVWELRRSDGREFIFSEADGSTSKAPIFAGDLGDGFRVLC